MLQQLKSTMRVAMQMQLLRSSICSSALRNLPNPNSNPIPTSSYSRKNRTVSPPIHNQLRVTLAESIHNRSFTSITSSVLYPSSFVSNNHNVSSHRRASYTNKSCSNNINNTTVQSNAFSTTTSITSSLAVDLDRVLRDHGARNPSIQGLVTKAKEVLLQDTNPSIESPLSSALPAKDDEGVRALYILGRVCSKPFDESMAQLHTADSVLQDIEAQKKEAKKTRKLKLKLAREKANSLNSSISNSNISSNVSSSSVSSNSNSISIDSSRSQGDMLSVSIRLLKAAASFGHQDAMCSLGTLMLESDLTAEAIQWFELAASSSSKPHPDSLFNLGLLYFDGVKGVVEKDFHKSFSYFVRGAVECEDPECLYWVAHCYISREGRPDRNNGDSRESEEKVDDKSSSSSVSSVSEEEEIKQGFEFLVKAASKGHGPSHYYLATVYSQGLSSQNNVSIVEPDAAKFNNHLQIAVSLEEGDAMLMMAQLQLSLTEQESVGDGNAAKIEYNPLAGLALLQRARALGHGDAILLLAHLSYNGLEGHMLVDRRRAFELYNEAATAGNQDAWLNLASMYDKGEGVPKCKKTSREIMRVIFNVIIP